MLSRRTLLTTSLMAASPLSSIGLFMATDANAQGSLAAKLLEPGPLPDKSFGNVEASVTVIEYASITCHFCMKFHTETWPDLKKEYIDTGKVRFIMREFPLDALASAGFMLARCAGEEKWYPVLDLLYRTKESWGHSPNPSEALLQTVRQAGFSKESFEACLSNEELFQNVKKTSDLGKSFGVDSTPTFFVNGRKYTGALTLKQFKDILDPLLQAKP